MSLLISPEHRKRLTTVDRWKIISSIIPPECPQKTDSAYTKWQKQHADSHPQREAVFCLEGNLLVSLENHLYTCPPGTLLLIDANEKHDKGYPPGSHAVHLWLYFFQKRVIVRLITITDGRISSPHREVYVDSPGLLSSLLLQEWGRIKDSPLDDRLKRMRLVALFSLLFVELIEADLANESKPEDDPKHVQGHQRKIIRLIEEHIRNTSGSGLSLEKLARIAGYSKYHFLRVFKQQTGQTVHDYINTSRVSRIAEMEAQGARQKEIAAALGFSCSSAYAHWRQKQLHRKSR